jgi:hypothetical protein
MVIQKVLCTLILLLFTQSACTMSLQEQFNQVGYVELCDENHGIATYDSLYECFDELVTFLQANPAWAQKLYIAKERFIRSENRNYYSTDFFGFYDESAREGRNQISFYYSTHFQDFIFSHYQEFKQVPQITNFFASCLAIQQSSRNLFNEVAAELHVENIFFSKYGHPPILLKVVKYLPSYSVSRPHYDGTAFSLFLDSTDNQSLLLSPYRSAFTVDDFSSPLRKFSRSCNQNSILLIPGTLLTEFSIYPTPHIVEQNGKIRYATIAFAMRPNYILQKNNFSLLPNFKS